MPISLSSPRPPPQGPAPQDPPPPRQRNSRVSEGNINDQHQDFHRQLALVHEEKAEDHKRRSQRACQHRLLLQRLVLLLLLCFVLGVLSQHYFPMDVSTDIFPPRSFQVGVSGVHAGVGGSLREKFASSKLMGLYGAPRDVAPLFQSSLPSLESEGREFFCIFGSCTGGRPHAASRVLVIASTSTVHREYSRGVSRAH